jgi:ATP-dependent helicase HepA
VETDPRPVRAVLEGMSDSKMTFKSLERRADALFPPRTETIFLDVGLSEIVDSILLDQLRQPFRKAPGTNGVDHNLTKHRCRAIDDVVPEDEWERLCREARDAALRLLRERSALRERCERYATDARKKLGIKLEQLRLRESRGILSGGDVATRESELEQILGESLIAGIQTPLLRVDSVGFIVISGRGPLPPPYHAPSETLKNA